MSSNILTIKNLSVDYGKNADKVHALRNVSLKIEQGECLGIAGESGCGKSTLAMALLKLLPHTASYSAKENFGKIFFKDSNILDMPEKQLNQIRGKKIAMIFQNPMTCLNPFKIIEKQLEECYKLHSKKTSKEIKKEIRELFREVQFEDIERVCKAYPHELSGGMCQRVMIAMAISQKPELLIADEPTTALDVTTQKSILKLLNTLRDKYKMSMLFISHDLAVLNKVSDRIAVMYAGEIIETAPVKTFFKMPVHPYSKNLMEACPTLKGARQDRLKAIEGSPPDLRENIKTCAFLPRCEKAKKECEGIQIDLLKDNEQQVRCCLAGGRFC